MGSSSELFCSPLQAVQLAMDRKDRERELTSALLAVLSPQTISEDQMSLGFTRLLASVEVGFALRSRTSRLAMQSVMTRQVEGSDPSPQHSTAPRRCAGRCSQQAAELLSQDGWASLPWRNRLTGCSI